jgi:phosphoribosylformylglycinamidine synthase subunit PurQ / glutaminase
VSAVRVCVLVGHGINADEELALGFAMAGGSPERVHVADLIGEPRRLAGFRILAIPGGFSYGDHLGSGKVFATLIRRTLRPAIEEFSARGGLVVGICNGFQILVKAGILPNLSGGWTQEVSLTHNDSGVFEDRWVRVAADPASPCLWTRGLDPVDLPVRHGEGKFIAPPSVMGRIRAGGLAALRYVSRTPGADPAYPEDPNGSQEHVAGICDPSGRIFGLMPHPEAFLFPENHPEWGRRGPGCGEGLAFFRNGVDAAR